MVYGRAGSSNDPLAMAAAQVATGKSGALLEKERQKIILDDAASQAFTVTSTPKITSTPAPAAGHYRGRRCADRARGPAAGPVIGAGYRL